jgi:thiosulfate dehydrogenase
MIDETRAKHHDIGLRSAEGIGGAAGRPPEDIIALLRGPLHRYDARMLSEHDVQDLANFVSKGQLDYRPHLDERNRLKGNALRGKSYYTLLCVECHGEEGNKARHGTRLGELHDNGAEILHKLMNGQPGEDMRSLRVIPHRIAVDIGTYVQTLPR